MSKLTGKVAIITGASGGIGKSIAKSLAEEGMDLVLAARNQEVLEATVKELTRRYETRILAVPCDVAKQEDLENLTDVALK